MSTTHDRDVGTRGAAGPADAIVKSDNATAGGEGVVGTGTAEVDIADSLGGADRDSDVARNGSVIRAELGRNVTNLVRGEVVGPVGVRAPHGRLPLQITPLRGVVSAGNRDIIVALAPSASGPKV